MHHRPPHLFDKLRTDSADVGVRALMAQRRVQSKRTQQTPEQVIASLNHDTTPSQPLADVFDKAAVHQNLADIQAITNAIGSVSAEYKGWATVDARIAQLSAEIKLKELNEQAAQKQKELTKTQADINAAHSDGSAVTPEELAQLTQLTEQLNTINLLSLEQKKTYDTNQTQIDQWSPNGSKGKYLTSITNTLTTKLTGQTPYATVLSGIRNLLAEQLHDQNTAERVIGHALISCAVAIATGTNCGSAAAGATASIAIADTFANLFTKQPNGQYSNQQKEAISALTTLAIGLATAATGSDTFQAFTAADAAKNEAENNSGAVDIASGLAYEAGDNGYIESCETPSCKSALSILDATIGLLPIGGNLKGAIEAYFGSNSITGDSLSDLDRALAVFGPLANVFKEAVVLSKIAKSTGKADDIARAEQAIQNVNIRIKNISKSESPIWQGLTSVGNGRKTSGSGSKQRYYEWDNTHNDIELYDKSGKHLGSVNPITGEIYKPAVTGRTIDL